MKRAPNSRVMAQALKAARAVRLRAHAPYSNFLVGAAVVDESGRIHSGCNVENASYGLTICAERNAITTAVAAGARAITAVVVVTNAHPPATPCGACRQVMAEFGKPGTPVILAGPKGRAAAETYTIGSLLPASFSL